MRNINIMGMELRDYGLRESLNWIERFLQEGVVHTVLYLTGPMLLEAGKDEQEKAWIEAADLMLWGDEESLRAAGITAGSRQREVNDGEFLRIFLYRLAKEHLAVLALADTEEHAEKLKSELKSLQDGLTIVGTFGLDMAESNRENMINKINLAEPAVIIARTAFGEQLRWLEESKALLNTEIWVAVPEQISFAGKKDRLTSRLVNRIKNGIFMCRINKYIK